MQIDHVSTSFLFFFFFFFKTKKKERKINEFFEKNVFPLMKKINNKKNLKICKIQRSLEFNKLNETKE